MSTGKPSDGNYFTEGKTKAQEREGWALCTTLCSQAQHLAPQKESKPPGCTWKRLGTIPKSQVLLKGLVLIQSVNKPPGRYTS